MSHGMKRGNPDGLQRASTVFRQAEKVGFIQAKDAIKARIDELPIEPDDAIERQHKTTYMGDASIYFTYDDAQVGYPETLRRLRAYPLKKLETEKHEMRYATSDPAFGRNATAWVCLIDKVLAERASLDLEW